MIEIAILIEIELITIEVVIYNFNKINYYSNYIFNNN